MKIIFENKEYGYEDYREATDKFKIELPYPQRVAVILDRHPNLLFLLYYLFINNITYITIDPLYPYERIQYMLKNSKPDLIIVDSKKHPSFKLDCEKYLSEELCTENISYIQYTSGSTGNPKGVEITTEGLTNLIDGISEIIDFSAGKRIACFTTMAFDMSFPESIMALHRGLTVVLANNDEQRNPKLMAELIINNNIDMIHMTPSRVQLLLNYDKELNCLNNVKEIMIGAEPFPLNLLKIIQEKTTAKIYNMYGPTETTVWSTISELTHKNKIDVGRPIKNTQIYIMDEDLNNLDVGQTGEICIAGKSLARGYCGQDNMTAERFVFLPQNSDVRIYRTGDFGRYLPDGNIEYLGRMDNQIKIRGYRIELEEIEANINKFQGISQTVVRVIDINETDKLLEAMYVGTHSIDKNALREFLIRALPNYMIPAIFAQIYSFSYTPNGKIDRKRLSECIKIKYNDDIQKDPISNRLTDIQKRVLEAIASNLSGIVADNISVDMELNSIGLDSISFIKAIVALEDEFNFEFDDEMLLIAKFSTVKSMIEYVAMKSNATCRNA